MEKLLILAVAVTLTVALSGVADPNCKELCISDVINVNCLCDNQQQSDADTGDVLEKPDINKFQVKQAFPASSIEHKEEDNKDRKEQLIKGFLSLITICVVAVCLAFVFYQRRRMNNRALNYLTDVRPSSSLQQTSNSDPQRLGDFGQTPVARKEALV